MRKNRFLTFQSFLLSLAFHVAIGVLLVFSFNFSSKSTPPPTATANIVKATSVDKKEVEKELKRIKDKAATKKTDELKRQRELKKKEAEIKKKLKNEKKKLNEIKKKKQAEAKKLKAEKLRLKKLIEEKKKREKEEKLKEERKKKQAEAKRKREEEKKKRAAEEKRKAKQAAAKKAREAALQKELAAELQAKQQQQDLTEIQKYQSRIKRALESKFNRLGLDEGLSCVILIRMIAGGKVVEVSILTSSGNDLFDKRAEEAVYKASPLPVPDETRVFEQMRNIKFTFEL